MLHSRPSTPLASYTGKDRDVFRASDTRLPDMLLADDTGTSSLPTSSRQSQVTNHDHDRPASFAKEASSFLAD